MHQDEPGDHRRQAHGQVGDHVDDGEHAGPLVRGRERDHRADRPLEPAAEPGPGDSRPHEEPGHRAERHGQHGQPHPGDQRRSPDERQRARRLLPQHQHRHRAAGGQHDSDRPPSTMEPDPETSWTSAGPSAPYRPARAQTATRAGTASSSGLRVCGGSANRGRMDASAPGSAWTSRASARPRGPATRTRPAAPCIPGVSAAAGTAR